MAFFKKSPSFLMNVTSFDGIDCTKKVTNSISSAEYMRNFRITENGKLKKRYGYKKLFTLKDAKDVYLSDNIVFYRNGRTLNAYNIGVGIVASYELDYAKNTVYFTFASDVYAVCEDEIIVYRDGNFSKGEPYVPTLAVTCPPSGGGALHESLNLLCNRAALSYSPDGKADVYHLPSYAVAIVSVFENGIIVPSEKYTFDSFEKTVKFNYIPAGGISDSLKITFELSKFDVEMDFLKNRSFCVYGGNFDSRIFAYGGDNIIYYSDITDRGSDVLYFPSENYIKVGDGTFDVTSLVRHYSTLAVFTEGDAWYISPSSVDYDGYEKPSFPIYPLNGKVGSVRQGGVLVDNSPLTVTPDGVYLWRASNVRDERNAECISEKIEPLLSRDFLKGARVFDNEAKKEVWICNSGLVAVYNYSLKVWYFFDGIDADSMFSYNGEVLFIKGESVYLFDPEVYTDDGKTYKAIWQSGFANFGKVDKKRLYMLYASLIPETSSSVKITLVPNSGERITVGESGEFSNEVLDFSCIDFSDFTFECEGRPTFTRHRIRLRRFDSVRLIIENSQPNGRATVERVVLR